MAAATEAPWLFPLAGLRTAASVLIALNAVAALLVTWSYWDSYWVVRDYLDGVPGVGEADLEASDRTGLVVALAYAALLLAAGVVFLVWLWRARRNAEVLCAASHTRGRGWVIGGWFCPIVNLWFPHTVITDVWKTSNPSTPENYLELSTIPGSRLLRWWWGLFLVSYFASRNAEAFVRSDVTVARLQWAARFDTIASIAWVGAAALIIVVMWQITQWQATPRQGQDATPASSTDPLLPRVQ